jgi:hypothetical protein
MDTEVVSTDSTSDIIRCQFLPQYHWMLKTAFLLIKYNILVIYFLIKQKMQENPGLCAYILIVFTFSLFGHSIREA